MQNPAEILQDQIEAVRVILMSAAEKFRYSYRTFGCQMNENDSERLSGMLEEMGWIFEPDFQKADLIFYNTCCVRESAEEKIYGSVGALKSLKQNNPDLIIFLAGCMTEQEQAKEKLKKSYTHVDFALGTDELSLLPGKILSLLKKNEQMLLPVSETNQEGFMMPSAISRKDNVKAFITIMKGCNNFCSYCIVPYVRGREASRAPADILNEARILAVQGYREVTLLGQNVNSYGNDLGFKELFSDLLRKLSDIEGIERIRFMTSHPKDLSDSLIYTIRDVKKVCNSIHLPLQSGSTRVLKEMNRKYTREDFYNIIYKLRNNIPDITITTDLIVGFPGETDSDFEETLNAVTELKFDNAYMFKYSKRSGTEAAKRIDPVSKETVKSRFDSLLKLQNDISHELNLPFKGSVLEVLTEGRSKQNRDMLTGRTEGGKLVHYPGSDAQIGKIVPVKIHRIKSFSLEGIALDG